MRAIKKDERTEEPMRVVKHVWVLVGLLGLAALAVVVGLIGELSRQEQHPWGVYTTQGMIGEPIDLIDNSPVQEIHISRTLDEGGFATVVDPSTIPISVVRCGPRVPIVVTAHRTFETLSPEGGSIRETSNDVEFTINPPPSGGDCGLVFFDTLVPPESYLEADDGLPIRVHIAIDSDGYLPVVLTTEWFTLGGEAVSIDVVKLPVPETSPFDIGTNERDNE